MFGVTLQPSARLKPPAEHPVLTDDQITMWSAIAPSWLHHVANRRWFIAGGKRAPQLEWIKKAFPRAEIIPAEGPWECITIIETKEIKE